MEHWIKKKRPLLDTDHAEARLEWCVAVRNWTWKDWFNVIFTDECSLERGSGKRPQWTWCYAKHRLDPVNVSTYNKGKDISIMIWGAIWKNHRSDVVVMTRDPESPRGGYSANSYIQVLENQVPAIYRQGMKWQQDNASIHTAHRVAKYFEEMGVTVLVWPADSCYKPVTHAATR